MSWLFRRRRPGSGESADDETDEVRGLISGRHRSPAFELVRAGLERRRPGAVLDLGDSENIRFLSRYSDRITILDLFQSARPTHGTRATPFRFHEDVLDVLPDPEEPVDLLLVWDLLHYFEPPLRAELARRLAELCAPGATAFLLTSATVPIPMTPIRFRIDERGGLRYRVPEGPRAQAPDLRVREVEKTLVGFEPVRLFQLRNGLQEFLFRREG